MCSRNADARLLLASCLLVLAFSAHAQDAGVSKLEWRAVEGARSYEVAIRKAGEADTFFRDKVRSRFIEVSLDPGSYEIMITAYNVLAKPIATAAWTPFAVRLTADIENANVTESSIYAGSPESFIHVIGTGVFPDTAVGIETPDGKLPAFKVVLREGGLDAWFDTTALLPGSYALLLENPGGKDSRIDGGARVLARKAPEIDRVEPGLLANDRAYPAFTIIGAGFDQGVSVGLTGVDGKQIQGRVVSVDDAKLVAVVNLAERAAGDYSVLVVNPGGLFDSVAIQVVDAMAGVAVQPPVERPPEESLPIPSRRLRAEALPFDAERIVYSTNASMESAASPDEPIEAIELLVGKSAVEVQDLKITQMEPALLESATLEPVRAFMQTASETQVPAIPASVWLGWRPAILLSQTWLDGYRHSLGAAETVLHLPLGGPFAKSALLRMFSIEVRLDGAYLRGKLNEVIATAMSVQAGVGTNLVFSFVPIRTLALYVSLRVGYGQTITYLDRDGVIGDFSGLSQDPTVTAGVSIGYATSKLGCEAGMDWQGVYYVGVPLDLLRPFFRFGYKF